MAIEKTKRTALTLKQKLEVINFIDNENLPEEIMNTFSVSRRTVERIAKFKIQ